MVAHYYYLYDNVIKICHSNAMKSRKNDGSESYRLMVAGSPIFIVFWTVQYSTYSTHQPVQGRQAPQHAASSTG